MLYIHGGPHADYGNSFFHEFQVLAAHGYGVLYRNPRGGRSYGEAFTDAVRKHYGEKDYEDLMHAADLGESWDWVDPRRMCVVGGSYGGFMTNWITTQTDRFVVACSDRSICNWLSFMGTSDIGPEFGAEEIGRMPWQDEELLTKSPITHVKHVRTPTLVFIRRAITAARSSSPSNGIQRWSAWACRPSLFAFPAKATACHVMVSRGAGSRVFAIFWNGSTATLRELPHNNQPTPGTITECPCG